MTSRIPELHPSGPELIQFFGSFGATNIEVLNVNDEAVALTQLENANLIWMGGGSQLRLVKNLAPSLKSRIALSGSWVGADILPVVFASLKPPANR